MPPGMRTGGSTGALNLSPSTMSQENPFEVDRAVSLPPRMAAQLYDRGGIVETTNSRHANAWTTLARDGDGGPESDAQRRQRNREVVVVQWGSEELDEEHAIPRSS